MKLFVGFFSVADSISVTFVSSILQVFRKAPGLQEVQSV